MGLFRPVLSGVVLTACTTGTAIVPADETETVQPGTAGEQYDEAPTTPNAIRLAQTDEPKPGDALLGVGCEDGSGSFETSFYRVFPLAPHKLPGHYFDVNRVNFAVQRAAGAQRVKVYLGTYGGTMGDEEIDPAKVEVLAQTTIDVPPTTSGETLQANFAKVGIPAQANLIVEIKTEGRAPGQRAQTTGPFFDLGATPAFESWPGYVRAPDCGIPNPQMTSVVGYLQSHLIISVSGTD